jgi:hypothetical protein
MVAAVAGHGCRTVAEQLPAVSLRLPMVVFFFEMDGCRAVADPLATVRKP